MDRDAARWLVFAVTVLILGVSVIIPTAYNACTASGDEIQDHVDTRHIDPMLYCRVPLFFSDSDIPDSTRHVILDKGATYDDYIAVLHNPHIRHFCYLDSYGPLSVFDDNLPSGFARSVLDTLDECEASCGREYTDYQKAVFANAIVRTGINYYTDDEIYGVRGYIASPLETLFLERGDCEDVSLLFLSILRVLDIDGAAVTFPGHVAAGAKVNGLGWQADGYTVFECTEGSIPYRSPSSRYYDKSDVERVSVAECSILDKVLHGYFSYCALVHRLIPVRE